MYASTGLLLSIFAWGCTKILSQTAATGPHSKEQGYFLAVCISHCWLSALISIRWHCLASLSTWHTFSACFFSLGRLIFNKNSVLSFLLCPSLGQHLAKHIDAYYKEALLTPRAGGPLPPWTQIVTKNPNIWDRYPLCSVCFLSITFQRLGILFPWGLGEVEEEQGGPICRMLHVRHFSSGNGETLPITSEKPGPNSTFVMQLDTGRGGPWRSIGFPIGSPPTLDHSWLMVWMIFQCSSLYLKPFGAPRSQNQCGELE